MRSLLLLLLLLLLVLLAACPKSEPIPTECARAGDRCQIREGLLGVCSETTDCATPPCLRCTPQH